MAPCAWRRNSAAGHSSRSATLRSSATKVRIAALRSCVVLDPEQRRRMDGGHDMRCQRRADEMAALLGHPEAAAKQRLRRGRAEADQNVRLDERELLLEPWQARLDLHRAGLAVNPALAARHPLEVLDHVGDVGPLPVDPCLLERPVEQLAGRADERPPFAILDIARLLADQHEAGTRRSFAEHRLGRVLEQRAGRAAAGVLLQLGQAALGREQIGRRPWRDGNAPASAPFRIAAPNGRVVAGLTPPAAVAGARRRARRTARHGRRPEA